MGYFRGYSYYDTPDGTDCVKKLIYTTKYAAITGGGLSTFWVTLVNTPPTYGQILAKYAFISGPCVAAAAAGTITVCTLVSARQKDDEYNHFFGGLIGGISGGLLARSIGHGIYAGLVLGGLSAVYKNCKTNGYDLWGYQPPFDTEDVWSVKNEWRFTTDHRPKDWVAK